MLHLHKRDVLATLFVATGVVLYVLWAVGTELPGMSGARATGIALVVFGVAASASAVVPSFGELLHGNKAYVAVASLIGAAALVAGIMTLIHASGAWLGVLVGTTALLWAIATIHHMLLARRAGTDEKLRSSPRAPRRHVTV